MKRDHTIMFEHAENLAAAALRMAETGHFDSVMAARSASAICYRVARQMRQQHGAVGRPRLIDATNKPA